MSKAVPQEHHHTPPTRPKSPHIRALMLFQSNQIILNNGEHPIKITIDIALCNQNKIVFMYTSVAFLK